MSHKMGSFELRRKTIYIILVLITTVLLLNTFYAAAVGTYYSNFTPAKSSTITISNPAISAYVKSASELVAQSLVMKVNGNQVNAQFWYKGKWVDDWEGGEIWYILDRREGTVKFEATNLKDGINTVEISMTDKAGNVLNDSWSFIVAEPPKFSVLTPVDKSEQKSLNQISAAISDNTAINWGTLNLKINNSFVDASSISINTDSGSVIYNRNFSNGSYSAVLEIKDNNGNTGTRSWNFIVDNAPPEIIYLNGIKDGDTILDGKLNVTFNVKDLVDIKDNIGLTLDGTPLKTDFKYDGFVDYDGSYTIRSRKRASITYTGTVGNGQHVLSLYTEDKLGNSITRNWNFTVSAKPVISNETPIKYGVDNLKPTISAMVKSPNGSVNPDSIELKLDGTKVSFSYDQSTRILSFTPSEVLKNESYHTVNLTVSDQTGLSVSKDWKFYTNTYPDMKDSNASSCTSCHQTNNLSGSNGVLEDVHSKKLYFNGTHSNNRCENCHNYVTVPAGCSQCHADFDGAFDYAPHGTTSTIKYQPKNYDSSSPLRITENRELYDCIVCHQPGSQVKSYVGYLSTPTRLLNNHDIPELHKASDESCTKCHAQSLTREHAREDRNDKEGNKISCNTCHQSTDPKVVKAISDKTTECSACHGEASHDELHVSVEFTEPNCTACHSNTLTIEHKKRNLTCADCHESQEQKVITAIENKDKTCQACHAYPVHENQHSQCSTCHPNKYVPAN